MRWNDFETNISVAFKDLREEKDFFDITIVCDDNQIQAHKVILSACSPFFRNILRRNPHQHPLLYLKGVKYQDVLSVLNFMYNGEVNIAQEELNTFLSVAEDLKVKGLTQNDHGQQDKLSSKPSQPSKNLSRQREAPFKDQPALSSRHQPPQGQERSRHSGFNNESQSDMDIQEIVPVKSEPRDLVQIQPPPQSINHEEYAPSSIADTVGPGALAVDQNFGDEDTYGYEEYGEDYAGGAISSTNIGSQSNQGNY